MKNVYGFMMLLAGVLFLSADAVAQYCSPRTSGSWDGISSVTTTGGTINISKTTAQQAVVNNYTATDSVATNYGQSFTLTVRHYMSLGVWVDWNDDGDFFDAGETITVPTAYQSGTRTSVVTVTVPNTAAYGQLRMRVMGGYYYLMAPCGYSSYTGEVEDYRLWIPKPKAKDAGITELQPAAACAGNNDFKIRIMNFGLDTLTSVTVSGTIKEVGGATTSYGPTTLTNLSIPRLEDTVYTVATYNVLAGKTYDIDFEVSSPSGVTDGNTSNDKISKKGFGAALGGTYTIGASSGADYSSISDAEAAMKQYGICAPTVFNIESGTYTEQVKFTTYTGISATNNVRFRPAPGNTGRVVWTFNSTSSTDGNRGTAVFNGTQYVSVDSITMKNTGSNTGTVIELVNSPSYLSFDGDSLIGNTSSTSTSSNMTVIRNYQQGGEYVTVKNSVLLGSAYAVYSRGANYTPNSSANSGWVIENNEILDFRYMGLYLFYHRDTKVNYNVIDNNGEGSYGYGAYIYYSYLSEVMNNYIHMDVSSWSNGLYMYYCRATSGSRRSVTNNMVAIEGGGGTHYASYFRYCDYNDIDNNTFSVETGRAYPTYLYFGSGVRFRNNIIYSLGTQYRYYQRGTMTMSNNMWWAPNAASTFGNLGSSVINGDPKFVSFSDLHAKSPLAHNSGIALAHVTDDIDGDVRCPGTGCPGGATAPDRGADEFWLPDYDISPKDAGAKPCVGLQDVQVMVSNVGVKNLTSFTVNWSIGGVAQTPLVVTGSNVQGGADTIVTVGTHTFVSGTSYNFEFITSLPSGNADQQMFNDTLKQTLQNAISGNFTVGLASSDYANFSDAVADMNRYGICGPITLQLEDTTISDNVTLDAIPGNSSVNTITFTQKPGNANPGEYDGTFKMGEVTHVNIKNLVINTTGNAIEVQSGKEFTNLVVDSNTFNLGAQSGYAYYDGLYEKNCDSVWFTNNTVNDGYYGVRFYGGSSTQKNSQESNIFINGNTFDGWYQYGVYTYYSYNIEINDNYIKSGTGYSYPYGINSFYNSNVSIEDNFVQAGGSFGGYGIYAYSNNRYGTNSDSLRIINNYVVAGKELNTGTRRGMYVYWYNYRAKIYHNNITVLGNTSGTREAMYTYYLRNSDVKNNIFECPNGTTWYERSSSSVTKGNNAYWTTVAGTSGMIGTMGANSLTTNPRFKNPAALDLRVNSIQLDSGAANVGVAHDIYGNNRVLGFHDIGAHEFDPCYFDGAMLDVNSIYTSVPTGQSVYIFGKVGNRGLSTVTGTRLNALVAGSASNTLIDTLLSDNDTTVAVLANTGGTAGVINAQMYTTINENDCDSLNDTLTYAVNVSDSVYAMDDSTYDNRLGFNVGFTGEFGNVFEVFNTDVLTTGSFFLNGPVRGASVKLKLYEVNDTASTPVQGVIDSTREFQIGANGTGWYTLEFGCGGVTLQPGKYLIAIQQVNPVRMELAINTSLAPGRVGTRYERGTGSTWNDLYASGSQVVANSTLLLRANFGEISDKEVLEDTTLLCFGSSAQIKPNKEYKFQTWSTGEFFDSIKVTQPGVISVRVEDEIGCVYMDTTTVIRTQQIAMSNMVTRATCDSSDGVAIAMASGTYAPFTYEWSNGSVGDTLRGIAGDVYKVTATDSEGCTEELDVEVLGATPAVSSITTYPTCNGDNDGSAEVSVDKGIPGYSYAWSSGGTSAKESNLSSGTYTVTVEDKSKCPKVMSVSVVDPPAINVVMKNNAPSACKLADGSAEAAVSGGIAPFTYFWSNSQTTGKAVGLTEGVYDVTITDSLGCVKTGKVKVVDPNSPIAVPSNLSLDCSYDTATAKVTINGGSGPFKYSWSTGSTATELNGIKKGTYQVRVEDAAGCDHDTMVVVTAPDPIKITFANLVDGGENKYQATAVPSGGTPQYSSYTWSNGETGANAKNLPNGVNTVTVVDANGCSHKAQIDIYSEFTGIGTLGNADAFRIYPNPTTGVINVEFNLETSEDVTIKVMNAVGEVIEIAEHSGISKDNLTLDITGYASGIYFVETAVGTEKVVSRIQLSK